MKSQQMDYNTLMHVYENAGWNVTTTAQVTKPNTLETTIKNNFCEKNTIQMPTEKEYTLLKEVYKNNNADNIQVTPKVISLHQGIVYNETRKPILKLYLKENTKVHAQTQKEYDNLMQIYESAGLKLKNNENPTTYNFWELFQERTAISNDKYHIQPTKTELTKDNKKQHEFDTFCQIHHITPNMLTELNIWYNTNKPDRESKG
jgi:hypothetical protein